MFTVKHFVVKYNINEFFQFSLEEIKGFSKQIFYIFYNEYVVL